MPASPVEGGSTASAPPSGTTQASTRRPSQPMDFEFLTFNHPNDAKASLARRTVRSHVTRQQHQRTQNEAIAHGRRGSSSRTGTGAEVPRRPSRRKASSSTAVATASSSRPPLLDVGVSKSAPGSFRTPTAASQTQSSANDASESDQPDPWARYPPTWRTAIPTVIEYYLASIAESNLRHNDFGISAALRHIWMPFVLVNTALSHSVLLFSASHYASIGRADSHSIDTIALRSMALRAINDCLESPATSVSDALIGAVLTMAMYEAVFGHRNTYVTHMAALQNIITMRGGLGALGLDGLLEKILLWVDANASQVTTLNRFFPPASFPSAYPHPTPQLDWFSRKQRQ